LDRTPGIRPRPTLWRRLDAAARHGFPASSTALLLLLAAGPLGLPGQAQLQPAVAVACVFFWSLFRPAAMAPPMVFALGLLADLLALDPVGVSVLTLLIVHGLAMSWRRGLVRQGFLLVWLVFVLVAAGTTLLQWALISLLSFALLPPGPGVFQFMLTAGLYPALATLFTIAHRSLAAPEKA
jgi:rod shape-determining protein MreD